MSLNFTSVISKDNIFAEEQRYVVKTSNGIIDQDMVGKYKVAHDEA